MLKAALLCSSQVKLGLNSFDNKLYALKIVDKRLLERKRINRSQSAMDTVRMFEENNLDMSLSLSHIVIPLHQSFLPKESNDQNPSLWWRCCDIQIIREIAIMKKLAHYNIVNLVEVIDDPTGKYLYMVLEYVFLAPHTIDCY